MDNTITGLDAKTFAESYLEDLSRITERLDVRSIAEFVQVLIEANKLDSNIFFIGNGGSAATASHFANDISFGHHSSLMRPFRAVSLTDNAAVVTALANDFSYDEIFVRQLAVQMVRGDVVVAISASGNSPNIVRAVEYANANGGVTVGLTGFDGGHLRKIAKLSVHVPTEKGNYGHTEDIHMIIDHLISAYILKICEAKTNKNIRGESA